MKTPVQAKKVFSGVIFDIYQWQQKMFDGKLSTYELIKRPDTVQVIATNKNKIFIAYQKQPHTNYFYSLFGGRVDPDEKPLQAAKRELLEESGLASDDWELISAEQPYGKMDWKIYTYIARHCKKIQAQHLDSGEIIEPKIVSFTEFSKLILEKNFRGRDMALLILQLKNRGAKHLCQFKKKLFG